MFEKNVPFAFRKLLFRKQTTSLLGYTTSHLYCPYKLGFDDIISLPVDIPYTFLRINICT